MLIDIAIVASRFDSCQTKGMSALPTPPPNCPSNTPVAEDRIREAADIFKALADPVRLRLYLAIRAAWPGDVCVCDLPDQEVSQATVSHHLRKLRESGLVTAARKGTWVHYCAVRDTEMDAISIIR